MSVYEWVKELQGNHGDGSIRAWCISAFIMPLILFLYLYVWQDLMSNWKKERNIDFCSASLFWCTFYCPYVQPLQFLPNSILFPLFIPSPHFLNFLTSIRLSIFLLHLQNLQCCLTLQTDSKASLSSWTPFLTSWNSHFPDLCSGLFFFCFNPRNYYHWSNYAFEKDHRQ